MRPSIRFLAALLVAWSFAAAGCVGRRARLGRRSPPGFVHVVRHPGETFASTAAWFYGSPAKGRALAKANGMKPDRVLVRGDKVRIPGPGIVRTSPVPSSFVRTFRAKAGRALPRAGRRSAPAPAAEIPAVSDTPSPERDDILRDTREELLRNLIPGGTPGPEL